MLGTNRLKLLPFVLGGALAFGGSAAQASAISSFLFPGELNQLSDNDAEQFNDLDGNGFFSGGDTLRGTFQIDTIEDLTGGGGTNNVSGQITGLFQQLVISSVETDAAGVPTGGGACNAASIFCVTTFGADPAFAAEIEANNGLAAGDAAGTTIAVFGDAGPSTVYNRNSTIAVAEATATDTALELLIGFTGDADENFLSLGPPNPNVIGSATAPGTAFGVFNFDQGEVLNLTGVQFGQVSAGCNSPFNIANPCAGDGLVTFAGSGSVLGTLGITSAYPIFSNLDITAAPLDEPSTLAMMGLSLMGVGVVAGMRRRRRRV